jgi:hypothetical protein
VKLSRRRTRTLLAGLAVAALVAGAPRRAAALDDTWRNVLIGTGAALTLGAVVGLIIYVVQEPYEPPKPKTAAGARLPSFQMVGLGPLPVGADAAAAAPARAERPSPLPSLMRF